MHTASLNKDCVIELRCDIQFDTKRSHKVILPSQSLMRLNLTQQLQTHISRPKHTPTPNEHRKLKCRFGWLVYLQCGKRIGLFYESHPYINFWRYYVNPSWNNKNDFDWTVTKETLVRSSHELRKAAASLRCTADYPRLLSPYPHLLYHSRTAQSCSCSLSELKQSVTCKDDIRPNITATRL